MKINKYITTFLLAIILLTGCQVDEQLNYNPNRPSTPDTRFLFLRAEVYTPSFTINGTYDLWVQIYPQYIAEMKNIQFTLFSSTHYSMETMYAVPLNNLQAIIDFNTNPDTQNEPWVLNLGDNNSQIAAATTLKAFFFMHLTDIVGALPYSEALKGDEGNFTPKFDTQQEIYTGLFKELNDAYSKFSGPLNSQYDILYGGNIEKWKKLNASIRMMMAIKLQKADPAMGKTEFAKAYNDGAIVDNADNLIYTYLLEAANENPLYDNMVRSGRKDYSPSSTLINYLKEYNDPRLKAYAEPNQTGEYVGATFGWLATEASKHSLEEVSAFDPKYYQQNSPVTIVSASQVLFMQAEAAHIGWIAADAAALYNEAITASLKQHEISDAEIATYLAQSQVLFSGSDADKIKKFAMQKWFANFMQDGVEAWSDWRRFGIPVLLPGEAGSANIGHVPYRKTYNSVDIVTNKENYDAAIAAQGADNVSTRLWWNK